MAENDQSYDLYTEKIKERPFAKHKKLCKILKITGLSVFAGVVAGGTFLGVVHLGGIKPVSTGEDRHEVVIPMEDYPGLQSGESLLEGLDKNSTGAGVLDGSKDASNNVPDNSIGSSKDAVGDAPNGNGTSGGNVENVNGDGATLENQLALEQQASDVVAYSIAALRAEILEKSMVTVTAIHQNQDVLLSVFEQQEDYPGILVADNEVEYLILTEGDAVKGLSELDSIEVTLFDESTVPAKVVMVDNVMSMAVVAVKHLDVPRAIQKELRIVEMGNSYMLKRGELLLAMGNMYGINSAIDVGMAVNTKEVAYEIDSRHGLIYTSMNGYDHCAGFIFNEAGQLIGCISPQHSKESIVAYGISDMKLRIQNMTNAKEIAYLGIIGQDIPEDIQKKLQIPSGVYLMSVEPDSPAYFAGFLVGDIITDIGGRTISNAYNVERTLCEYASGDEVKVTVNRLGRAGYVPIEYTITLGRR